jgi:uncharacterized membrane protein YphA (DoxX/SURF4 family)
MTKFLAWPGHSFLALPIRLYLGVVFLFACVHKILEPSNFAVDIATYQILPLSFINIMAIVLPWLELIAGIMLVIGLRSRTGALLVAGMMAMFTVAVAIAVIRGLDMSCGCFASQGAVDDPISWSTVARDAGWLALALYVWIFDRSSLGIDRLLTWRLTRTTHGT